MNARPKSLSTTVSVVITVYNEEPRFLAEAIESAWAQTIKPAEVIIVEDGALRDYSTVLNRYPEITVLRQENKGLAAARNRGLAAATGEFILFLDADDRLMHKAVEHNLRRFAEHPDAVFVYGGYRFIDSNGRPTFQVPPVPLGKDSYTTMLEGNCIGMHAAVLYRREKLVSLGGFNINYRACEDYELYLRVARVGCIVGGSEVIAEYRQHRANMSGQRAMMLRTILRVLKDQDEFVRGSLLRARARAVGIANWRSFYARGQCLAVLEALNDRSQLKVALTGLLRLLVKNPFAVIKVIMVELFARLKARIRHGTVNLGDLRRTSPISRHFGFDRGTPVDRRYIEDFLTRHAYDIRGRTLEVGDNSYSLRFGGERVTLSEVVHVDPKARNVTYRTDLTEGAGIPANAFDCIVLTQTLHLIFDLGKVVDTLHRILKPGGVLLLTVPGISSIDRGEWGGTWYWSFTPASLRKVFEARFSQSAVEISSFGNVLTATAFLYGLAQEELRPYEFNSYDPHYPVIVAARVTKE